MALVAHRRRGRHLCAGRSRRRVLSRAQAGADRRAASWHRRAAPGRRPAVATQGDPALERPEGAPRRGEDLCRDARRGRGGCASCAGRPRLARLHAVVPGRVPGGARGRDHRSHLRQRAGAHPACVGRCSGRPGRGRDARPGAALAACARAREHAQVRGRDHAHVVRRLLGSRGRRERIGRARTLPCSSCSRSLPGFRPCWWRGYAGRVSRLPKPRGRPRGRPAGWAAAAAAPRARAPRSRPSAARSAART